MFFVHTAPEKFENATITCHFGFVFEENPNDNRDYIVFDVKAGVLILSLPWAT